MIELAPNIFYIPGENNSSFPYCACLYLKGRDMRVLIDVGMGAGHLAPAKKCGIDILILTHCHAEASFLNERNLFYNAIGLNRSGMGVIRTPAKLVPKGVSNEEQL